jgi:integrase
MAQKGSLSVTKLYKRNGGDVWYFKYTDTGGKRCQRSTGCTDRREALRFQKRFLELSGRNRAVFAANKSFRDVARLYLDPQTNPRMKEALIAEHRYSMEHALNVARYTRYMISVCDEHLPGILDKPIAELTKLDVKAISAAISAVYGKCRTAQHVFSACKMILNQAATDDLMLVSPGTNIPNIGYKEKTMTSIHEQDIAWMLGRQDLFPSLHYWVYITVLATTGMRRGEAIAVSTGRIIGGMLTIDQQIKANSQDISDPKWGLVRTIPLAKITLDALARVQPDEKGFYFPLTRNWVTSQLGLLKASLKAADPGRAAIWGKLTPHVLRRSLNTNLLLNNGSLALLVAEYLSWHHQNQALDPIEPMQRRYFEAVSTDLRPVADAIDKLFGFQVKHDAPDGIDKKNDAV